MLKKECERVVNRSVYYLVNCFQSFENKRKKKTRKNDQKDFSSVFAHRDDRHIVIHTYLSLKFFPNFNERYVLNCLFFIGHNKE